MTTATVEIKIATQAGQIESKKIGSASMAIAFDKSKVESRRWWSLIRGLIEVAAAFSLGVPFLRMISS